MISPSGLIRARSTSTKGFLAEMRNGSMPWQLVPWARMIFSSLAFIRYSIEPWFSAGQPVFCMQCRRTMSM